MMCMTLEQLEHVLGGVSGKFLAVIRELVPRRDDPIVRMKDFKSLNGT